MAKKTKMKKAIVALLIILVSLILAAGIAGLAVYNFVIIPKYNQYINSGEKEGEKLTNKDIVTFAKYLTDKDFIESITNVDKDTAKGVLSTLLELEEEGDGTQTGASGENPTSGKSGKDEKDTSTKTTPFISLAPEKKDIAFTQANTQKLYSPTKNPATQDAGQIPQGSFQDGQQPNLPSNDASTTTPSPSATNPPTQNVQISKSDVPKKHQTAYDRIMAAASKEEIQVGMAIIAKVNMGKVNSLQASGKNSELKAYIKSVLSSSEISTALRLYRKYKHLL